MTDGDAWEDYWPPYVCSLCSLVLDPTEIADHQEAHWEEWLRAQCPIPPFEIPKEITTAWVDDDEDVDVPF